MEREIDKRIFDGERVEERPTVRAIERELREERSWETGRRSRARQQGKARRASDRGESEGEESEQHRRERRAAARGEIDGRDSGERERRRRQSGIETMELEKEEGTRVTSDDERERRAERATAKRETSDGGESDE
jgi:hypothetical protein